MGKKVTKSEKVIAMKNEIIEVPYGLNERYAWAKETMELAPKAVAVLNIRVELINARYDNNPPMIDIKDPNDATGEKMIQVLDRQTLANIENVIANTKNEKDELNRAYTKAIGIIKEYVKEHPEVAEEWKHLPVKVV